MEPNAHEAFERIRAELEEGRVAAAVALLQAQHPADAADVLRALDEEDRVVLTPLLGPQTIASIVQYLGTEDAADLASRLDPAMAAEVLDHSEPDVAADVLGYMDSLQAAEVLGRMTTAQRVGPLLLHEDDSAAGVMTPDFISLEAGMTVDEALQYLRAAKPSSASAYYIYVVDADRQLLGSVSLRTLVVSGPRVTLRSIMNPEAISVPAGTDQEEAVRLMRHYDLLALPVVDDSNRLIGVITPEDMADVMDEESTEDMYRLAGIPNEERALGPVRESLRRRVPWLLVNLCTAFLSGYVVSLFSHTIEQLSAITIFMPVVAGHGGNTGTQAATIMVRSLALGEVTSGDTRRVLQKEIAFSLIHGTLAGVLAGALGLILIGNPWLGLVVTMAMFGNIILAGFVGSLMPMFLRMVGLDPALMSSIFLTTFTDIGGFLLLLGLGTAMLSRITGG